MHARLTSPLGTFPFMYALSSGGRLPLSLVDRLPWGKDKFLLPGASGKATGAGGGALTAVLSKPAWPGMLSVSVQHGRCLIVQYIAAYSMHRSRAPVAALTRPLLSLASGSLPEGLSTFQAGFFLFSLLGRAAIILDIGCLDQQSQVPPSIWHCQLTSLTLRLCHTPSMWAPNPDQK